MNKSSPLIFFGTEAFSAVSLEALVEHNFSIAAVVTKPDTTRGRGRALEQPQVKRIAERSAIPVWQPQSLISLSGQLKDTGATAGVVVAYGKVIPQDIIDLFPDGLINVHASLLPKYRGASPIENAILNGDTQSGVTIMRIEAGLDTGPTFAQAPLPLTGKETKPQLYDSLAKLGAALLTEHLAAILERRLGPTPQDDAAASTVKMIKKSDGQIDWSQPANKIERQIRAYLGWPGSRATLCEVDVTITKARVGDTEPLAGISQACASPGTPLKTSEGELAVVTGHGELIIQRLIPSGKREMTGQEFLAGHPIQGK